MAVATPTIEPSSGTYNYGTFITITTSTPGATIYYTLDGTIPDSSDIEYFEPFYLNTSATVRAIGYRTGDDPSAIQDSSAITINAAPSSYTLASPLYIEAHGAQTVEDFMARRDKRSVTGIYMLGLDDDEDGDDEYIEFDVAVGLVGTYYIWILCTSAVASKVEIRVDAGAWVQLNTKTNPDTLTGWGWFWKELTGTYIFNAAHTIRIRRLKDGFTSAPKIDRICLTTDGAYEPPSIVILSPNAGERLALNTATNIMWDTSGTINNVMLEYSTDAGENWSTIISSTPNNGSYIWTTPNAEYANCLIRISDVADTGMFDVSDDTFLVTNTANPYTSETVRAWINPLLGEDYWDQGDRATYLAGLMVDGAEQNEMGFRGKFFTSPTRSGAVPDIEAIEAYRTNNNDTTLICTYNHLYNIAPPRGGEDMNIVLTDASYDSWFLEDSLGNPVTGENDRPWFDFRNMDYLTYVRSRIDLFYRNDIQATEFDSFAILRKKIPANGYWRDDLGANIEIINPRTGLTYTSRDWINDVRYALNWLRGELNRMHGSNNSLLFINGLYSENLTEHGDLLDGYFREGYCGTAALETTIDDWWFDRNIFEVDVNALIDCEARDKYSILGVGYVTGAPWTQSFDQASLYCVCAMLMGIRSPDTKAYIRTRNWFIVNWTGLVNLQTARFVPLGRYEKTVDGIYKREFAHALVYVNPTQSTTATNVALPNPMYYMQDDGTWSASTITQFDLGPGRGAIFVENKSWFPTEPVGELVETGLWCDNGNLSDFTDNLSILNTDTIFTRIRVCETGVASGVRVKTQGTGVAGSTNIRMALYSDSAGFPNELLTGTDDVSSVGDVVFAVPLITPLTVHDGQYVWLAIQFDTSVGGVIGSLTPPSDAQGASYVGWGWSLGFPNPSGASLTASAMWGSLLILGSQESQGLPFGTVYITDGTDRIDLNACGRIFIKDWIPFVPGPKGNGTWRSSTLAPGRELIDWQWENWIDVFNLGMISG